MVKGKKIEAILTEKGDKCEARCGFCGKKLLEFEKNIPKNSKKVLTTTKNHAIISVRCSRCVYTNSFRI